MKRTPLFAIVISLALVVSALAQKGGRGFAGQGPRRAMAADGSAPQFDALRGLKRALSDAGAAALTSDQEAQLNSLVASYRSSRPGQPGTSDARASYDGAILNGDLAGAQAAAATLGSELGKNATSSLQSAAALKIQALKILSSDQLTALSNQNGPRGVLRALDSLGFGGFGFAPRFGSRSPGQ